MKHRCVTIMSDASRDPKTGVSGYGYWIASDRGKKGGGGVFKSTSIDSINLAELKASVNAVHIAVADGLLRRGDRLIIQLDSTHALNALKWRKGYCDDSKRAISIFKSLTVGMKVICRHVKAHTNRKGARYKSNGHCDRIAKRYMREARDTLKKEQT